MESTKEKPVQTPIVDQFKEYADTRLKLIKYQAIEKVSSILADAISNILLAICTLFAILFASITLACYLASILISNWAGFGCVTLLYLLISVLVLVMKKSFQKSIINSFIKKSFN